MAYQMLFYLLRKGFYVFITVLLILSFNFVLFRAMPGDITTTLFPKGATNETKAELREYYGLDQPKIVQYFIYMKGVFTGEWGKSTSYRIGVPIMDVLWTPVANTLLLVGTGTIVSVFLGVILGRETAWRRGRLGDRVGSAFFLVFYCMPTFLFALILLTMSTKYLPDWPAKGATGVEYPDLDLLGKIWDRTTHTLLPMFALTIETIATFSIITRSSLIDVLTEDYMVTAVAKGLKGRQVLKDHAMPNAMLPVVTVIAMNVGWVLSGSIMIEVIFSYQGLGYLTWRAVWGQDFPLLQAAFMLETVAVLMSNFVADILLGFLDPRVKTL
jgi:peptide/nickel transport system permease protein